MAGAKAKQAASSKKSTAYAKAAEKQALANAQAAANAKKTAAAKTAESKAKVAASGPTAPAGSNGEWAAAHFSQGAATEAQTTPKKSKVIDPFLLPEEQQAWDDLKANSAREIIDLDYNLTKSGSDTAYGILQAQRKAERDSAQTIGNMIARGLFQSSIKDGDLADIAVSSKSRQELLSSALASLATYTESRKKSIGEALARAEINYNSKAVANAKEITPEPDPETNAPASTTSTATPAPAAPAAPTAASAQQAAFAQAAAAAHATAQAQTAASQATVAAQQAATPKGPWSSTGKVGMGAGLTPKVWTAPQSGHVGMGSGIKFPKAPTPPKVKKTNGR